MPEVQNFQGCVFGQDSIVDVERRVKNAPYSAKAFHRLAEAGKTLEEIYMVQECVDESFGAGGMILPGPRKNFAQVR